MIKLKNLIYIASSLLLISMFQNCGHIETGSISYLSNSMDGTESIDGFLEFYDLDDINTYLQNGSNIIYTTEITVSTDSINIPTGSNTSSQFLCLVESIESPSQYNPVAFYDNSSTSINYLMPICMPQKACLDYITEIDATARLHQSSICSDTASSISFDSEHVLQLVKRY